jgi:hypothetical protein
MPQKYWCPHSCSAPSLHCQRVNKPRWLQRKCWHRGTDTTAGLPRRELTWPYILHIASGDTQSLMNEVLVWIWPWYGANWQLGCLSPGSPFTSSISILCSLMFLGHLMVSFLRVFPPKLMVFLHFHMLVTCPTHLILLHLFILIIFNVKKLLFLRHINCKLCGAIIILVCSNIYRFLKWNHQFSI